MNSLEKQIICYTSRKSSVLRTDAHSKLGSEAGKKNFQKISCKKRCRRKPNTCLKKRGARRKFSNGQHVENIQRISQHSSSTGQGVSNLSTDELACGFNKGNSETAAGTIKLHRRRRRKRKRKVVDHDEASRLQRRTRYLLIKMKLEQNLIDAYSGDGWNGHRREKLKPEKELQRAQKQIVKCKLGIRDAIHQLDSLSCVGSIADSLMHPDGSVFHEYIFCAKCRSSEAFPDNDIILCDGTCNRGFHQKCLEPPLEKIPPGDQAWLCKFCTCKLEILETINAHLGTCFSVNSSWEDIFMEATTCDVENACFDPAQEWPSDDSEDEDYNPDKNDNSNSRSGIEENLSDDSGSFSSLFSDGAISYSDLEHYEEPFIVIKRSKNLLDSMDNFDSGQSNECEITSHRRQRKDVDYKKLHDEMFGKEPPENESQTEDEDWGPNKRKRRRVEASSIGTCTADSVHEDTCSNPAQPEKIPSDRKKQLFRIPPVAVEKLRLAFAENELPSRSVKENLSKQLGIASEKVSKWFKNARYAALKTRKNETNNAVKNQHSCVSMNESLSQVRKSLKHLRGQKRFARDRKFNKRGTDHDAKNESDQLYLAELERLYRLEDKLQNLRQTLLLCSDEDKLTAETCIREQNLIYVPVVEIKEKA